MASGIQRLRTQDEAAWFDSARLRAIQLRAWLRAHHLPLSAGVELIYHPCYLEFPLQAGGRQTFDVRRPARVLARLQRVGLLAAADLIEPTPVSWKELALIHSPAHLASLQDRLQLAAALRLPSTVGQWEGGALLRPFLWQTGGTVLAALRAVQRKRIAVNLGGGFHHAQRDRVEGFCPVNDIAVAIAVLRQRTTVHRVMVIDLDYHQGDGTAQIFAFDEEVFTLSLHGQAWAAAPRKRNHLDRLLPPGVGNRPYMEALEEALEEALAHFQPELIIYLAGADVRRGDRFGDFALSEDGVLVRDVYVAKAALQRGIPLAVVLGGGYGAMAWTSAFNLVFRLISGVIPPWSYRPSNISADYLRVHRSLRPEDLGHLPAGELADEDLVGMTMHSGVPTRLLGYYTRQGIELAFERYGFCDLLRERGFDDLLISIDTRLADRHVLRIHFEHRDPDHLLIEVAAALRSIDPGGAVEYPMVRIEWLLMQNPKASFALDRPPLPGQQYPGLGLFRWFGEILRLMAVRLERDGLMNNPEHFHNGHLYGKVMRFLRPDDEAVLRAIERDLGDVPLVELSAAINDGRVVEATSGEVLRWSARSQVLAVTPRLQAYFAADVYQRQLEQRLSELQYRLVPS